jgi:hypothetical protein
MLHPDDAHNHLAPEDVLHHLRSDHHYHSLVLPWAQMEGPTVALLPDWAARYLQRLNVDTTGYSADAIQAVALHLWDHTCNEDEAPSIACVKCGQTYIPTPDAQFVQHQQAHGGCGGLTNVMPWELVGADPATHGPGITEVLELAGQRVRALRDRVNDLTEMTDTINDEVAGQRARVRHLEKLVRQVAELPMTHPVDATMLQALIAQARELGVIRG